jgi:hypothetical protein
MKQKKKKIQNDRLRKFKMAASKKKLIFQLRQFSIFFHENFIGLVELIDAKGIGLT